MSNFPSPLIVQKLFGNIGDVFKRYFPRKKVNNVPQKGVLA